MTVKGSFRGPGRIMTASQASRTDGHLVKADGVLATANEWQAEFGFLKGHPKSRVTLS